MRTIGRILIILAALAVVMGVTYFAVNASGMSSNRMPRFENGERAFPQDGQFEQGGRPSFLGGEFERERHDERRRGGMWMFGWIKNIGIIAVLVTVIVWPKSIRKKKNRSKPAAAS